MKLNLNQLLPVRTTSNYITLKNPAVSGIFCFKPILVLLFAFSYFLNSAQPKLVATEAKKNFGFVKRGTLIKNEYEITNIGNQPLIITDAEVSCSCTTVDFPKQPLLPDQKAVITILFNTTTVYGRQDRVVSVISNDPKGPLKLRYKGNVSKE